MSVVASGALRYAQGPPQPSDAVISSASITAIKIPQLSTGINHYGVFNGMYRCLRFSKAPWLCSLLSKRNIAMQQKKTI
jgi:hypothetical protein